MIPQWTPFFARQLSYKVAILSLEASPNDQYKSLWLRRNHGLWTRSSWPGLRISESICGTPSIMVAGGLGRVSEPSRL